MRDMPIADLLSVQSRFLRSTHLERDFADPKSLSGYILTPQTSEYIRRLAEGLNDKSGQRAWRITGDYGSGKSSFALLLAHLLGSKHAKLPEHLRRAVSFKRLGLSRPNLLPILVTGSQEPLAVALLRSLQRDIIDTCGRGRPPLFIDRLGRYVKNSLREPIKDATVIELIKEASAHVVQAQKASGLLILLDELGKFLEYGALHPERQDVFLLQSLAEAASRSGRTPVFVVGLLHQGFSAYSEHLSPSAQKEWEKVAGRFDEVLFNQPIEHTARLITGALDIRSKNLPKTILSQARQDMAALIDIGWYGASCTRASLIDLAPQLYPVHPSVVPILLQLFSRFGQNERSLFSFLLSNEPFGLQEFSRRLVSSETFYRLHDLYDYARYSFGARLTHQSFRNNWNHIDSVIESFPVTSKIELRILKTIGLMNLLDTNLFASQELLEIAIRGTTSELNNSIRKLKSKRVVYHRGVAGGYCLWPHTSINLDKTYQEASRALGQGPPRIASCIADYLETRPIVARRHYIETGNLRHFDVRFSTVDELPNQLQVVLCPADGRILVALCETEEERNAALCFAQSEAVRQRKEILFAVPAPLRALSRLVLELQRWEWVGSNTPELANDSFATEEVSRQLASARDALLHRIRSFIGLQHATGGSELTWFRESRELPIRSGRELLSYLSRVCDELYVDAPRVANELVNRQILSSAAAAARMRLIERIFGSSTKPHLGMEPTKKPPEMSIYLSILKNGQVHRVTDNDWTLVVPNADEDCCNLRPALQQIQDILESEAPKRRRVSDIFDELRKPPFGIRAGLAPIILAVYCAINEQHVAFYDSGVFMKELIGLDLLRLTKLPDLFEIQFCRMAGLRSELFERLLRVLGLKSTARNRTDILDVVRPLCIFASQLPIFTQKTRALSDHALAVRSALLSAREPGPLLFRDLPSACGFGDFIAEQPSNPQHIDCFVVALKHALDELKMAYPVLRQQIRTALIDAFGLNSEHDFRYELARRSRQLMLTLKEPQLKAFCNRLTDIELPEPEWLESIGSLIGSLPPARWTDLDLERFVQELSLLSSRFCHVESMAFNKHGQDMGISALRLSITQPDGSEVDRVVYVSDQEQSKVAEIENKVIALLRDTTSVGVAGATRALWTALSLELAK
jgi:hypothetical protein